MTERADAIVVGAGHNGLVCAAYLAREGLDVVCLDANDTAGGMAAPRYFGDDFRTPGLAAFAAPLPAPIRRDLDLGRFGYAPGEPADTIALAQDAAPLVIGAEDIDGGGVSAADRRAYAEFRQRYLAFAKGLAPLFGNAPPRLKNMPFSDKAVLGRLGLRLRFGLGRDEMREFLRVVASNIYDVLDDTFESDVLKGALAADAVMGSAMGPRTPGTVLTWLQRLFAEREGRPCVQPVGLATALAGAAEHAGVDLRLNAPVERILVDGDRAVGVELSNGEQLRATRVVSATDPRRTFLSLVGTPKLDAMFAKRVTEIRGTGVVAKLHLGLSELPAFRDLEPERLGHRLLIAPSPDYVERAFNHAKYGECSEHFVLDIVMPSLHDDTLAPAGRHLMAVNVAYVPYAAGADSDGAQDRDTITRAVIRQISDYAPGLDSLVVAHELMTPRDIESTFGAVEGHWHHGELSIHQSMMMRPLYGAAQYDTPVRGLFLCSAGCHPGGGLTGLPGRNAARRILDIGAPA